MFVSFRQERRGEEGRGEARERKGEF